MYYNLAVEVSGYGGAEGAEGSSVVAAAYGSKGSSGAPGEGDRGGGPGKLQVGFPLKLLLLLL